MAEVNGIVEGYGLVGWWAPDLVEDPPQTPSLQAIYSWEPGSRPHTDEKESGWRSPANAWNGFA